MIDRVTLPSGRVVLDTGKVRIGLLSKPLSPRDQGSSAELMQRLLTTPEPPREWHEAPRVIYTKPSLIRRLLELLK